MFAPNRLLRLAAIVVAAVFTAPLVFIVYRNVLLGADFGEIFTTSRTWHPFLRSIGLGVSVAAASAVVGTTLAWLTIRTDVPGAAFWRVLSPLPLVFPSFVGATALISAFAKGGILDRLVEPFGFELPELAGFWAALAVLTLFTYPYVFLPVAARLRRMPASLEESARLLGRSPGQVFRTIVVPQIWTSILAGSLLVFLYTISDFGAVQLLRYDTMTRVIWSNGLSNQPLFMALSLLLAITAITAVTLESRSLRSATVFPDSAKRSGLLIKLQRSRWLAAGGLGLFFLLALVGPVVSLADWVLQGIRSGRTRGALAISTDGLWGAIGSTVMVSLAAAALTVIVVLPISYLSARHRGKLSSITSAAVVVGFALPGIVLGLAMVWWFSRNDLLNPFYQTLPLLLLGYMVRFGAQASLTSEAAVAAVPGRVEDAARMLGAGRIRRFFTVELPIIVPGLLASAGLVLLSTMKELPVTLTLRPNNFDTLATRIWASMDNVSFAKAGLESLVLLAVSAVLTWFLVLRRSDATS